MGRAGVFGSARVAAVGRSLTGTFLQSASDATDLTTYTFASQNLGTASTDRVIAIAIGGRQSTPQSVSSVTIAGVTATQAVSITANNPIAIYYAVVPSGTTGDVVVEFSGGVLRCAIGLWHITGGVGSISTDTGVASIDITGANGGFIVVFSTKTGAGTATWTNATERFDFNLETFAASGADAITVGNATIGVSWGAATDVQSVAVAFAPA